MTSVIMAAALVVTNLPPVVVEASRLDCAPNEMPAAVHLLTADAIADSGSHDVVDLLAKQVPELHLRRLGGGNPALAEIALRGYGENGHGRTLVLVDGERLNAPELGAPNLSRIALGGVAKLEILGGAQTVLQGDGASAGVINVVTEPGDYAQKTYVQAHGGSWGAVGSAVGTRGGIVEDGVKYWADASWDRADGYRSHSGYDIWNLNAGIRKTWANNTYLRVSGFFGDSQYDLPGALTYREWKDDPRQSHATEDKLRRTTYGFATTFNAQIDDDNAIKFAANFSSRGMWGWQKGSGWISDNEYAVYSYRVRAEWTNSAGLGDFENECVIGVQPALDTLDGTQVSGQTRQRPDYDRLSADAYGQDTFRFVDWLALQLGARYSRTWSHNSLCTRDRRTDDLAAFEAALVANPTDETKLYAKGTRFYRNPFLDEVPGRYDAGYNWVNTEMLSPETGWTAEIGFDWTISDELSIGGDAYCTWLEDEIFYNAIAANNENCDDMTLRRGLDTHVTWEREKTAGLSAAFSYVWATFDGGTFGHNLIPLVPQVTLSLNGRVWIWDECQVFGGYRHQGDMYSCSDFHNEFGKMSWYGVFHVGVVYAPTCVAWLDGVKLSIGVDNLFDTRYCDYSTYGSQYYPAVGRTFTCAVRYDF